MIRSMTSCRFSGGSASASEPGNGVWKFTAADVDAFFAEPYVKEGLRIKRNSVIFDFLADRSKKSKRTCVILDLPASMQTGNRISAFFCEQMNNVSDTVFTFDWDNGFCRVILSGAEDQVRQIMEAYNDWEAGN